MNLENKQEENNSRNWLDYQKQNIDNLSLVYEEIKKWNISEEKMQFFVDYVWNLALIESNYDIQDEKSINEIKLLIKSSIKDSLWNSLSKYNLSKFDIDWQKWLDNVEQENYKRTIQDMIWKIILLWWVNKFVLIHREIDWDSSVDTYLSKSLKFDEHILWEKWVKHFVEEKFQKYAMMTEQDLQLIKEKPFNILSKDSWGDLSMLFFKEFWDWVEDVLRFILNIPSWIVFLPRYIKYRALLNSNNKQDSVEAEIKINELVNENPSLLICEIMWEKWIDMLKQLWDMLVSWKQWDIATMMVTIMWLLAWWAWIAKMWLNSYRASLVKSARLAWKESRITWNTSSRLLRNDIRDLSKKTGALEEKFASMDDILGWAWLSYLFKFWRQLSKTEELNRSMYFNDWFEWTIRQWNVGTCYLLASLEMMKASRTWKLNLLNMIEKVEINWQLSYNINLPWTGIVNISQRELDLIEKKWYWLKQWTLWDQIISAAVMKHIYESKKGDTWISFEDYIDNHNREKYADMAFENWQEENAIKLLMWEKNVIVDYFYIWKDWLWFNHWEMFLPPKWLAKTSHKISYEELSKYFDEWAMIWVWTKKKKTPNAQSDREFWVEYEDYYWNKVTILWPHAHWIRKIDTKSGFIELSEPFQSNKIIRFTLEQFSNIFNSVTLVRQRK